MKQPLSTRSNLPDTDVEWEEPPPPPTKAELLASMSEEDKADFAREWGPDWMDAL